MKPVFTAQDFRTLDAIASEKFSTPISELMENAGEVLAQVALKWASSNTRFLVFCGPGNNGGDGFVAARRLAQMGRQVFLETVTPTENLKAEALANFQKLQALGGFVTGLPEEFSISAHDVVLDALLGTGLRRPPEGALAKSIERMNLIRQAGAKVVSADIPSGLHSDSGIPYTPCVEADATVSFAALKVGQVLEPGASLCGQLTVADIGMPKAAFENMAAPHMFLLEESDVCERIALPRADSHKGVMGHVLVVAGSRGKSGAAALAAWAALRSGAGLVTVATKPTALSDVLAHLPEVMGVELADTPQLGTADVESVLKASEGKDSVILGPGIPRGDETVNFLREFLVNLKVPCVLDADALNALSGHLDLLDRAQGPVLLTPHPGEMARLMNCRTQEVQQNRISMARTLATRHKVTVALKGARTVLALSDGRTFINPTGNPGMATAGSGDILSGVCGALLARGMTVEDSALTGVFAHGLAGDLRVKHTGQMGLMASDLLQGLQEVWHRWHR